MGQIEKTAAKRWNFRDVDGVEHRVAMTSKIDVDYERCIARTKITVDDIEYSAFYDSCNLAFRDKNGKCVELDPTVELLVGSELDEYLGMDLT